MTAQKTEGLAVIDLRKMNRAELADYLFEHRGSMEAVLFDGELEDHRDLVVESAGRAVALISKCYDSKKPADIELLYVQPSYRRQGVGTSFLREITEEYGPLKR